MNFLPLHFFQSLCSDLCEIKRKKKRVKEKRERGRKALLIVLRRKIPVDQIGQICLHEISAPIAKINVIRVLPNLEKIVYQKKKKKKKKNSKKIKFLRR